MKTLALKSCPTAFIIFVVFISLVLIKSSVYSQTMEELQKKIQQSGMTEEQLKQKAEAAGYTLEDYNKLQQAAAKKEAANVSATSQEKVIVTPPSVTRAASFAVPEFEGREGAGGLQAFGYNVFNYSPTTFEPSLNVPVPTNYVVGPGDELVITLWGETQLVNNLTVSKNGDIYIPNVGLVPVNGLTLNEVRGRIFSVLSKVYASLKSADVSAKTKLDVSTGKLRSVKVYVLGEVNTPGGYTLPALSSSFTALYYCGGPTINGSLRNVQVMRAGKMIATIDLYEYLITGNKSKDVRLEDEDIIFVPPVGKRVAIAGNAFRPGIYELKENEKLNDLIKYAGGLKFTAYFDRVHIERIIPFAQRKSYADNILSLDLNFKSVNDLLNDKYSLESGDVVSILGINNLPENRVSITGYVKKPGVYELTPQGMHVKDLIFKADSLLKEAFVDKGILIRTLPSEKKEIYNFNVSLALRGDAANNLLLQNRDEVRIFNQQTFFPARSVEISGEVKSPGTYTRFKDMTVAELITLAGGLTDRATTKEIEVTRLDTTSAEIYSQKFTLALPEEYWKVAKGDDFMLKDFDRVLIKTDPLKNFNQTVTVTGEVEYPGTYTILHRGEKLSEFIKRSGGFKKSAYLKGIFVKRGNPIFSMLEPTKLPDSLKIKYNYNALYDKSKFNALFSGIIPIDWDDFSQNGNNVYDLVLFPGDEVVVPKNPRVIYVAGEVGLPSSVPYKQGAGLSYYIKQAGGYTENSADGDEVVIQPNGSKWESSGWFFIPNEEINSGATVFVPLRISKPSNTWPIIRDIVSVTSSAAILILSVKNLSK